MANGKQHIAVTTGWGTFVSQNLAKLYGEPFKSMPMNAGTLNVYALP
jgi:alcohol dehydrogenase (cytochrome c)